MNNWKGFVDNKINLSIAAVLKAYGMIAHVISLMSVLGVERVIKLFKRRENED